MRSVCKVTSCQVVCRFFSGSTQNAGIQKTKFYLQKIKKNAERAAEKTLLKTSRSSEDQPDWQQDTQWTNREMKRRHRMYSEETSVDEHRPSQVTVCKSVKIFMDKNTIRLIKQIRIENYIAHIDFDTSSFNNQNCI